MKKQFFLYKLGVIPLITLFCSVNAQTKMLNANLNTAPSREVVLNDNEAASDLAAINSNPALSTKALNNFNKAFKEAGQASWFGTVDGYKAEFSKEDIKTKVFYDRKGRWLATIRYYGESNLPKDVRHVVKSNYYDYDILHVQEVTVGNKTAYLVRIEDKTSIKTIRVTDSQMDEYISFEKSNTTR